MKYSTFVYILFILMLISCKPKYQPPLNIVSPDVHIDPNLLLINPQWFSSTLSPGVHPGPNPCIECSCSSDDMSKWNNYFCTDQQVYFNGKNICTFVDGNGGHVNWFPITYEGNVFWSDRSGNDDDYNFNIRSKNRSLYTYDHTGIGIEFDSDETVDHWDNTQTWWEKFHHDYVDDDNDAAKRLVQGNFAIVIGLFGLDGGHPDFGPELHPAFLMAIHLQDDPNTDKWTFFVRNWGDEGYCSSDEEDLLMTDIQIIIPHEKSLGGDITAANVWGINMKDNSRLGWSKGDFIDKNNPDNNGIVLNFSLDRSNAHTTIVGDITIKWKGDNLTSRNDFNMNPESSPMPFSKEINGFGANKNMREELKGLDSASMKEVKTLLRHLTDSLSFNKNSLQSHKMQSTSSPKKEIKVQDASYYSQLVKQVINSNYLSRFDAKINVIRNFKSALKKKKIEKR